MKAKSMSSIFALYGFVSWSDFLTQLMISLRTYQRFPGKFGKLVSELQDDGFVILMVEPGNIFSSVCIVLTEDGTLTHFPTPIPAFDAIHGEGFFIACEEKNCALLAFSSINSNGASAIVPRFALSRRDQGENHWVFTFEHEVNPRDGVLSIGVGWFVPCQKYEKDQKDRF